MAEQQRIDEGEEHHRRNARGEKRRPHHNTDVELRASVHVLGGEELAAFERVIGSWVLGRRLEDDWICASLALAV